MKWERGAEHETLMTIITEQGHLAVELTFGRHIDRKEIEAAVNDLIDFHNQALENKDEHHRLLMRARYAYYVKNEPFMTDGEYDLLEREFTGDMGGKLSVGSDRDEDYPEWAKS